MKYLRANIIYSRIVASKLIKLYSVFDNFLFQFECANNQNLSRKVCSLVVFQKKFDRIWSKRVSNVMWITLIFLKAIWCTSKRITQQNMLGWYVLLNCWVWRYVSVWHRKDIDKFQCNVSWTHHASSRNTKHQLTSKRF